MQNQHRIHTNVGNTASKELKVSWFYSIGENSILNSVKAKITTKIIELQNKLLIL